MAGQLKETIWVIYVAHLEAQAWIGNFRKSYANKKL